MDEKEIFKDPNKIDVTETISAMKCRLYAEKKTGDQLFIIVSLPFFTKEISLPKTAIKEKLQALVDWLG